MGVHLERADKTSRVRLEGSIDISLAEELKKVLVDALKEGKEISVHLGGTAYLDVTGVQLLWAAEREASRLGVKWAFVNSLPEAIRSTLHEAGFEESLFAAGAAQSGGDAA